jgi:hypothetical protein
MVQGLGHVPGPHKIFTYSFFFFAGDEAKGYNKYTPNDKWFFYDNFSHQDRLIEITLNFL